MVKQEKRTFNFDFTDFGEMIRYNGFALRNRMKGVGYSSLNKKS